MYCPRDFLKLNIYRVIFGLFVVSLINALLAWFVHFGGQPSLGRFVVVPYSINVLIMGFNGAPWDVQSFSYFFITNLYFSTNLSLSFIVPLA